MDSTSRPSMVNRSRNSSGDQLKSTYCLSQLSVTFIFRQAIILLADQIDNRQARRRERRPIILTEQGGDGGGDLVLADRSRVRPLAQGGGVWAKHGDPDVLGSLGFVAVVLPGG